MRFAVAALVFVAFAAPAARAQLPQAYTYDFRLEEGRGGEVTTGTVRVSGDRARVDVDSRKDDPEYFLLADGGRTLYVVHPERRTAERHDGDAFASIVGTGLRAASPVVQFTMREFSIDTLRLGDGGLVAGRRTQRSGVQEQWRLTMRAMGIVEEEMRGRASSTFWTDPTLPLMRNPVYDIVHSAMYAMASSDKRFSDASQATNRALARGGLLKADVTYESGDGDRERLRYEVTRITPGAVDAASLLLPKDYRVETPSVSHIKM
ncbi:MAG: hypothetical protein HYR75_10450 [Gemmatimonadetes bacterium]|nr:hypothetical protein [Gemmatimonadota bacterium]MBI3567648.1 hypothetical protein [Gemmatimonadota bacterium]